MTRAPGVAIDRIGRVKIGKRGVRASASVVVGVTLLAVALSGCSVIAFPGGAGDSSPTAVEEDTAADYRAVIAADPRITDVSATESYSGFSRMVTLAVIIDGDEPVTTALLTAILIAARDSMPSDVESLSVIARKASDEEKIIDLSDAVAGLPDDVTPLSDGAVTLMRADLEKLTPTS